MPDEALKARDFNRPLDQRGPRVDLCPTCGGERQELLVVPDRFYCERCKVATEGPNTVPPPVEVAPEPETLFDVGGLVQDEAVERPPIDEAQQWTFDED